MPDDAAGRIARCPQCSTVVPVPGTVVSRDRLIGTGQTSEGPSVPGKLGPQAIVGCATVPQSPDDGSDRSNPYLSPAALPTVEPRPLGMFYYDSTHRTGPPWEREGPSFHAFLKTILQQYGQPSAFYASMRRDGGWGMPLAFAWIGTGLANMVSAGYQLAFRMIMGTADEVEPFYGPLGLDRNNLGMIGDIGGAVLGIVLIPVALFIGSAIQHVFLKSVGGAKRDFETTFRVMCYSSGGATPLAMVPLIGDVGMFVCWLVLSVVGLSKAHETSGVRAALAVVFPWPVCGILMLGLAMAVFWIALGGIRF